MVGCQVSDLANDYLPKIESPMPVGSEWWGAPYILSGGRLIIEDPSPMPVGSEWWGAF